MKNPANIKNNQHKYWLGKKRSPETILKMSIANKGKKLSQETKDKIRIKMKGIIPINFAEIQKKAWATSKKEELNSQWKGDNAGYNALHAWLRGNYGKADRCESANCNGKSERYQWGNISGQYIRDRSDWQKLCNSCNQLDDVHIPERFKEGGKYIWQI